MLGKGLEKKFGEESFARMKVNVNKCRPECKGRKRRFMLGRNVDVLCYDRCESWGFRSKTVKVSKLVMRQ